MIISKTFESMLQPPSQKMMNKCHWLFFGGLFFLWNLFRLFQKSSERIMFVVNEIFTVITSPQIDKVVRQFFNCISAPELNSVEVFTRLTVSVFLFDDNNVDYWTPLLLLTCCSCLFLMASRSSTICFTLFNKLLNTGGGEWSLLND